MKWLGPAERQTFFRFLAVGVLNTVLVYSFYLLLIYLGVQYLVALTIDYAFGICTGFLMNRSWTFRQLDRSGNRIVKYAASYLGAYLLNLVGLFVLVEGAGGWLVPLNARQTLADLAQALDPRVILVVGLRLGCMNHALLTAESIRAHGCELAGWVANRLPGEMAEVEANIEALKARLACPYLGCVPLLDRLNAPAVAAPSIQPASAQEAAQPTAAGVNAKCCLRNPIAPAITAVS